MKFALKIFLLTVSVVVIAVMTTNTLVTLNARDAVVSGLKEEAAVIAEAAAAALARDPEAIAEYRALAAGRSDAEAKPLVDARLDDLRNRNAGRGVENVYSIVQLGDELRVAGDPSEGSPPMLSVVDLANLDTKRAAFASGEARAVPEPYADDYGVWVSAYAPIIDHLTDEVLAIIGIDLPLGAWGVIGGQFNRTLYISLIPAAIIAVIGSLLLARSLAGPVRLITDGLERVAKGEFAFRLGLTRRDEFGQIADAFDRMATDLEEKDRIRSALAQAVSPEIAEKILSGDADASGELVEGTVMFADIRGFTSLSDTISARETIDYVNAFLSVGVPEILAQGGLVEKFVGDEIFAVFGGPQPLEKDAVRAVDAGLAMRDALIALNADRRAAGRPEIHAGIGINTGMMVAGVIGVERRNNYTLLGATVNSCARICSAARSGEVLIGESTWLRVRDLYVTEGLDRIEAKGKKFGLNVFRVVRRKEPIDA